ncbi:ABC transporter substrate-binding protein [Gordonia jinhuaensis]|uniref:Thiamine pyrimidine synthase n=1 Tax=Gordonia jinhuaensis TaxID=1517702 RepID=A0A916T4M1_9ACTN|nr:ABC transporter substrate-binding protein [Gordonia jinhuaensis]GGB27974.1 nitrate ABC transporter substrate-binding protein [Gordonia jinhuaensis]
MTPSGVSNEGKRLRDKVGGRTPGRMTRLIAAVGVSAALAVTAACSTTNDSSSSGGSSSDGAKKVTLQLQWFKQGQFAGYIAAVNKGFYKEEGLDVTLKDGGTDIVPQTVLAQGQADYAVAWVPKALQSREQGAKITEIAQIYQKSGTTQISFKDKNIDSVGAFKGKKIGNWGYGNEFELFAGMTKAGLNPAKDVDLVQQQFDMNAFLNGDIDAAQAMTYNEYAQVLEAKNPKTGKLYQPSDLNVINWQDEGVGMLQDALWANSDKLSSDKGYQDQTVKFLIGSLKGWIYCRDHVRECRDMTVAAGSKLGASHQLWQVNEVNKLIWPSPAAGIGTIDQAAWDQTVKISMDTKNQDGKTVLTKAPDADAKNTTYITQAQDELRKEGVDLVGSSYQPISVTLNAGGN